MLTPARVGPSARTRRTGAHQHRARAKWHLIPLALRATAPAASLCLPGRRRGNHYDLSRERFAPGTSALLLLQFAHQSETLAAQLAVFRTATRSFLSSGGLT